MLLRLRAFGLSGGRTSGKGRKRATAAKTGQGGGLGSGAPRPPRGLESNATGKFPALASILSDRCRCLLSRQGFQKIQKPPYRAAFAPGHQSGWGDRDSQFKSWGCPVNSKVMLDSGGLLFRLQDRKSTRLNS